MSANQRRSSTVVIGNGGSGHSNPALLGLTPEQIQLKMQALEEEQKRLSEAREIIKQKSKKEAQDLLVKADEIEARVKHYRDKDDIDEALSEVQILRKEAHAILGESPAPATDTTVWTKWVKRLPFIQVALLALLVFGTIAGFYAYEAKINAYNEGLSETEVFTKKINAFNDANLQRVVFERFLQATDLVLIFLFILIVSPTVLGYVLPFVKTKKNFSEEFYQSLTPWERAKLFMSLFCALLIYFGLSHTVNQF